jgi:hypothetical protein
VRGDRVGQLSGSIGRRVVDDEGDASGRLARIAVAMRSMFSRSL